MGVMAERETDQAMLSAGVELVRHVIIALRLSSMVPLPGREGAQVVDSAMQAAVAGCVAFGRLNGVEPIDIIRGIAHAAALQIYQQDDIEAASNDFLEMVHEYGVEFTQDSSRGQA